MNGVCHNLPSGAPVSFRGSKIYVNGALWVPEDEEKNARQRLAAATLTKIQFASSAPSEQSVHTKYVDFEGSAFSIMRASSVTICSGDEFSAAAVVFASEPLDACITGTGLDFSTLDSFVKCTVEICIPPDFTRLNIGDCEAVSIDRVVAPKMKLAVDSANTVAITGSTMNTIEVGNLGSCCKIMGSTSCSYFDGDTMSGTFHASDFKVVKCTRAKTMSGDIHMAGILGGSMDCSTMSGDVKVNGFVGDAGTIKTMSGNVTVENCKTLSVGTMSGDLDGQGRTRMTFTTMSGTNRYNIFT